MAAYQYLLRHLPLRPVLLWGTVLCAACQASSLVLATRANLALGLDDHLFALGDSVLVGGLWAGDNPRGVAPVHGLDA